MVVPLAADSATATARGEMVFSSLAILVPRMLLTTIKAAMIRKRTADRMIIGRREREGPLSPLSLSEGVEGGKGASGGGEGGPYPWLVWLSWEDSSLRMRSTSFSDAGFLHGGNTAL